MRKNYNIKNSWVYIMFSQPDIYVLSLIRNTLVVGAITFVMNYAYLNSKYVDKHIPAAAYSLVAFAIGLSLATRMNTAYERWSSAGKHLKELENSVVFFSMKLYSVLKASKNDSREKEYVKTFIIEKIENFTNNFKMALRTDDDETEKHHEEFYLEELRAIVFEIQELQVSGFISPSDASVMQKSIQELIQNSGLCVRIKNNPIPVSFSIHIKVSIILYILSLPFGLFADMGMWSTVMVMVLYYIIAGIEIIAKEIENPFFGDPNDLPVDEYIKVINDKCKSILKIK